MTASEEQDEKRHLQAPYPPPPPPYPPPGAAPSSYYGTFQENPGFPQPVHPSQYAPEQQYNQPGYASSYGYGRIDEGYWHRERLPCCGLGVGWCLFVLGFFTLSIFWFVGAFIFFCLKHDPREHVGLAACAIAALMAILVGGSKGINMW